jgi:hypothetical protein
MPGNMTQHSFPNRFSKGRRVIADLTAQGISCVGDVAGTLTRFLMSPNLNRRFGELVLHDTSRLEVFLARVREKRKVAIISTYHNYPFFLRYHYRIANTLAAAGFVVYFVHATEFFSSLLIEIDQNDSFLCIKKNAGFDFGSYAVGFSRLNNILEYVDEVLFANDSVVGPITDMQDIFRKIRGSGADFAGITDSYERGYHVQTYFIWLGRKAVQSSSVSAFFNNPRFASLARGSERRKSMLRERMVLDGELALTRRLLDARLQGYVLCPYQQVASRWLARLPGLAQRLADLPELQPATATHLPFKQKLAKELDAVAASVVGGTPLNPTHFFWDVLIEDFGFPFIKRELVTANPKSIPSYFRISDVLYAAPPELAKYLIEIQQYFGGTRVPFIEKIGHDIEDDPVISSDERTLASSTSH